MLPYSLLKDLFINVAVVILVTNIMTTFPRVRRLLRNGRYSLKQAAVLTVLFTGITILSVVTGIDNETYLVNTRVIGALSAGLLGGPLTGFLTSFFTALFVLLYCGGKKYARAYAYATAIFGLLGAGFYPYFQREKWKYRELFTLVAFAELTELVCMIRFGIETMSILDNLNRVMLSTAVMIIVNGLGIIIFISILDVVFKEGDTQSAQKIQFATNHARIYHDALKNGLVPSEQMSAMVERVRKDSDWNGVMITNLEKPIAFSVSLGNYTFEEADRIPPVALEAMAEKKLVTHHKDPAPGEGNHWSSEYIQMAAPYIVNEQAVGAVIAWVRKIWIIRQSNEAMLEYIAQVGSYELAAQELTLQREMVRNAEFKALQFQVNPHFLFNALNTISYITRENAARARELLVVLADFFRYNLGNESFFVPMEAELAHIRDYLKIEKARFEEKLVVEYDIDQDLTEKIPVLILQPVVENAIKHGVAEDGTRYVKIEARRGENEIAVRISDHGRGFPQQTIEKLMKNEPIGSGIGISNVKRRMESIYQKDQGLCVLSGAKGSTVELTFPG